MIIFRKHHALIGLVCNVCIMLAGCLPADEREDVIGTYRLNTDRVNDVIEIRSNGLYTHSFSSPGVAGAFVDQGGWEFQFEDGKPMVVFHSFSHRSREVLEPNLPVQPGMWPVFVERSWRGRLRFEVDSDRGLYYVRDNHSPHD